MTAYWRVPCLSRNVRIIRGNLQWYPFWPWLRIVKLPVSLQWPCQLHVYILSFGCFCKCHWKVTLAEESVSCSRLDAVCMFMFGGRETVQWPIWVVYSCHWYGCFLGESRMSLFKTLQDLYAVTYFHFLSLFSVSCLLSCLIMTSEIILNMPSFYTMFHSVYAEFSQPPWPLCVLHFSSNFLDITIFKVQSSSRQRGSLYLVLLLCDSFLFLDIPACFSTWSHWWYTVWIF